MVDHLPERGYLGGMLRYSPSAGSVQDADAWTHYARLAAPFHAYGIGQTANGVLWVGTVQGLWQFDGGPWKRVTKPEALTRSQIDEVYAGPEGDLWVGTRAYGVFHYDALTDGWTRYDVRDGLADNKINSVLQTRDGSVWVVTEKGTSRFDGQTWTQLALPPELRIDRFGALHQSREGALWINTAAQAWFDRGRPDVSHDPKQSVPFRTIRYAPDTRPPETRIIGSLSEVSQPGNTVLTWQGADPWKATPDGELQYAYRLNQEAWHPFSPEKSRVFFSLPSGDHIFEVKARDRDFNEDPTPAVENFTVVPPVWRRAWFIELMALLLGAIGVQTWRAVRRGRRLQEAQAQLIEEMEVELRAAHDMQMGLLPKASPEISGMALAGVCIPANHVGGDYYSYIHLDKDRTQLGIVLADVSGHAMQAATVAMRFNEMVRYEVRERTSAVEILAGLDRALKGQIPPEMFVTCGIGILDVPRRSLLFASAGNPEVYHFSAQRQIVYPLKVTGFPLGLPLTLDDKTPFHSVEIALNAGDVVVFASDGIEEAQNDAGDFYGQERFASAISARARNRTLAEAIRDDIVADVTRFVGNAPQVDDMTVVVLRVNERGTDS